MPLKLHVRVNAQKFRIPCPGDSETVAWLQAEVSARYSRQNGLSLPVTIGTISASDGSILDPDDRLLDVCDEGEELIAQISMNPDVQIGQLCHVQAAPPQRLPTASSQASNAVAMISDPMANVQIVGDDPTMHAPRLELITPHTAQFRISKWAVGQFTARTWHAHSAGVSCVGSTNEAIGDSLLVTGGYDNAVRRWDLCTGAELGVVGEHDKYVRCLQVQGRRVISGGADCVVKVWDMGAGVDAGASVREVATYVGHKKPVSCLSVLGRIAVSGSWDCTVKLWDQTKQQNTATLQGHTGSVLCVAVDEQRIISGSADQTIRVWDAATGACEATLTDQRGAVNSLQSEGNQIVSAVDKDIKIWDIRARACVRTLHGHADFITCLQYDASRIVTGSSDKTVKVWSAEHGQCVATLAAPAKGVRCLLCREDKLFAGSADDHIYVWEFTCLGG